MTENTIETLIYELLKLAGEKLNNIIPNWVTIVSLICLIIFLFIILWAKKEREKKVSQRNQTKR